MAKGDSDRAQNQITYQGGQAQDILNNNLQRTDTLYNTFNGNFQQQYPANLQQQQQLMGNYNQFLGGAPTGYGPSAPSVPSLGSGVIYQPNSSSSSQLPSTFASLGGADPTALIQQYYQATGADPSGMNYWTSPQMLALYQKDPNYFQTKLLNGIAQDAGGNMSAFGNLIGSSIPGGFGPGTSGYGLGGNAMLGSALGPAMGGYGMGLSALGPAISGYGMGAGALGPAISGYGMGSAALGPAMSAYGLGATGIGPALAGYTDFSKTGGFTPQGIEDIRARDIAPTRAIYENAQNDLIRQKELQGGYFPGYATAQARLARQMSNQIGDINTNANAGIAQMIQQGRLAGLGGLQGIGMGSAAGLGGIGMGSLAGLGGIGMGSLSGLGNIGMFGTGGLSNMGLQGLSNQLGAMSGMNSLYGTTPAVAALTANNVLGANAQNLEGSQLQNQLGLGMIQNQVNKGQIPGNFAQGIQNAQGIAKLAGSIAAGVAGA